MSSLSQEILHHWEEADYTSAWRITSLPDSHRGWTIFLPDGSYGVAVPLATDVEINESFASVRLQSLYITNIDCHRALVLSSHNASEAFASLCEIFVLPGHDGRAREQLVADPVSWWHEWKNLLGNKSVDVRVYDVLGELVSLEALATLGLSPTWRGPKGASVDIDCGNEKYEVKSTLSRNKKTVQIHGLFQLAHDDAKRYLLFAQFEPSDCGTSINKMISRLSSLGFSRSELEDALTKLGYPAGNSSRDQCFNLLALSKYAVNETFPHIAPESFIGGTLPNGVTSINYGVSLDGIEHESLSAHVAHKDDEAE